MEQPIGTCSICGGTVVRWSGPWGGMMPPKARCLNCSATEGPPTQVIPMRPRIVPDDRSPEQRLADFQRDYERLLDRVDLQR